MSIIPPTRKALSEAFELAEQILRNIELNEVSLTSIALKASRLARLLNDSDMQTTFTYEAGGYPFEDNHVPASAWKLGVAAGRKYVSKNSVTGKQEEYIYISSISQLEDEIRTADSSLAAAHDPNVSLSSSNEYQHVQPISNSLERNNIRNALTIASGRLASRRSLIHRYVLEKYYQLKLSGIAEDIFARIRERVDSGIGKKVPDAVKRLSAAYESLLSDNPENWSNAVHSCRRVLEDLADAVFPATDQTRKKAVGGKTIEIKLAKPNYINRILAYVEDHAVSERYTDLVGSQISFLGDRLDAVFAATQKGSHTTIVSREEADRYVVYTYLLLGDILALDQQ